MDASFFSRALVVAGRGPVAERLVQVATPHATSVELADTPRATEAALSMPCDLIIVDGTLPEDVIHGLITANADPSEMLQVVACLTTGRIPLGTAVSNLRVMMVDEAMRRVDGNKAMAASVLGITRQAVQNHVARRA